MDHRNGLTAKEEEEEEMDGEETTNTELIFEVKRERTLNRNKVLQVILACAVDQRCQVTNSTAHRLSTCNLG